MKYEKEMKKGIIKFLQNEHKCSHIADEVNSGYGIADFVGMVNKSNNKETFQFNNRVDIYFLQAMKINHPVHIEEIERNTYYSRKYLTNVVLKNYIDQGLLIKKDKNFYVKVSKIDMNGFKLIAVEVKLSKWKEAFNQATYYKKFADYSFVALYKKYVKNVNLQLFRDNNIGLITVDNNLEFDILRKPKINRELYLEAKLFVSGLTFKTRSV